jgi:Tol biopolymer transport system component
MNMNNFMNRIVTFRKKNRVLVIVTFGILILSMICYLQRILAEPVSSPGLLPGLKPILLPSYIKVPLGPNRDPTGSKVAFYGVLGDRIGNLFIVNLTNEEIEEILPRGEFYSVSGLRWSQDGKEIIFVGIKSSQPEPKVYKMKLGSSPEYVPTDLIATNLSPDGNSLAVVDDDNKNIKIVNTENKTSKIIPVGAEGSRQNVGQIVWSPDSQHLAFVVEDEDDGYEANSLRRVDVDGQNSQVLVDDPQGQTVSDPEWVLGGEWISFLLGFGANKRLNFVREDGKCIVEILKDYDGISSIDIAEDVSDAVVEFNGDLYLLDIEEALAPLTLEETLKCR